jgi:hypothetical protein
MRDEFLGGQLRSGAGRGFDVVTDVRARSDPGLDESFADELVIGDADSVT